MRLAPARLPRRDTREKTSRRACESPAPGNSVDQSGSIDLDQRPGQRQLPAARLVAAQPRADRQQQVRPIEQPAHIRVEREIPDALRMVLRDGPAAGGCCQHARANPLGQDTQRLRSSTTDDATTRPDQRMPRLRQQGGRAIERTCVRLDGPRLLEAR
jgi:hypothetical protein